MKRTAAAITMLAALGGCMGPSTGRTPMDVPSRVGMAREVPGMVGPWGEPIPAKADGNAALSGNIQPVVARGAADDLAAPAKAIAGSSGIQQVSLVDKAEKATAAAAPKGDHATGLFAKHKTGQVPPPPYAGPPGAVAAIPGQTLPGGLPMMGTARSSIRFIGQDGMQIGWLAPTAEGRLAFRDQVTTPGRYNFLQGGVYRLRLSNIPKRGNLELYPTIEVVPQSPKTSTFLAHSAIPLSFTDDDFEQVASGNFVVKVIYLPDPAFQELATGLPDEVVSTKLEPGIDPIQEAQRRGSILAIIRMGNIDLETPNSPAMDAPNPYLRPPVPPPGPGPKAPPRHTPQSGALTPPLGSPKVPTVELPMPKSSGSVVLP